jgi:GxxExxY protein
MKHSELTSSILKHAFEVHKYLGPGLLESAYETCFEYELLRHGLTVQRQVPIDIRYNDVIINGGFKADLLVNDIVLIECKAISELKDVHIAQVLTYLKLSNIEVGLLINFNEKQLKSGIRRITNWGYNKEVEQEKNNNRRKNIDREQRR